MVVEFLEADTLARNDDKYLYLLVVKRYAKIFDINIDCSLESFLLNPMYKGLPCFETVRRARQRVQQNRPELASDKRIAKARKDREQEYLKFARES